jgi:hypothetical protein
VSALELYADIREVLMQDTVLQALVSGIYADAAPEGAQYPFVIIELAQVSEVPFLGNGTPLERAVIVTRVIDTDLGRIAQARDRIDEALSVLMNGSAGQIVAVRKTAQRVEAQVGRGIIERVDIAEHEFLLVPSGAR